ncbi:MAG TPA: protein-L-isoaspartate O-methyltransferase [Stellaceae bacterium]|nr:protein-L-isoaspartate O-methyltransferase [Stellaceae bacterium]
MTAFEAARTHMIDSQIRPNKVTDDRLLDALAQIRRELFVPAHLQPVAYIDEDLAIGRGRYLMEPMVAARLIQAASVQRTDMALVVGAGSGYEAAVLSKLARAVVAVEEDEELARMARAALVEENIASVSVVEGRLRDGYRQRAPYDVILFGGAVAEVPSEIVGQLAEEGRLVVVVKAEGVGIGRAILMTRTGGVVGRRVLFDAAISLLPGLEPKPAFVF